MIAGYRSAKRIVTLMACACIAVSLASSIAFASPDPDTTSPVASTVVQEDTIPDATADSGVAQGGSSQSAQSSASSIAIQAQAAGSDSAASALLEELQGEDILVPGYPTLSDADTLSGMASEGLSPEATTDAGKVYLALGDSISTGYQPGGTHLSTGAFTDTIATTRGYTLVNKAVDGNTAAGVYSQISGNALDTQIQSATLITLTVGGNDLVGALYQAIADTYNQAGVGASDIPTILSNSSDPRYAAVMGAALNVLPTFSTTTAFTTALSNFKTNFKAVITYIHNTNPDATIVVETQYNPYLWLGGLYAAAISTPIDRGIALLNGVIADVNNGAGILYRIADSHATFTSAFQAAASTTLTCATTSPSLNLDFHPNTSGHSLIATTMMGVMPSAISCSAASTADLTYDGTAHSLGSVTVTTPSTGATVAYGTVLGTYDLTAAPSQTHAGTYTTYYRVAASGYETVRGSFTTSIAKATPTLALSGTSGSVSIGGTASFTYTYDGDGDVTATSGDTSVATASVNPTTGTVTLVPVSTGTATITVSAAEGTDYTAATDATFTLTVSEATIACTAAPATGLTYDGTAHPLGSVTVTTPSTGATVAYGTVLGTYDLTAAPSQTHAGTYTTYYRVAASGYETVRGSFTTSIARKDPTLSATPTEAVATLGIPARISYSFDGDGTVTATSSDNNVATVTADTTRKIITVTPVSAGSAVITITAEQGTDYNAKATQATVTVKAAGGSNTNGSDGSTGADSTGSTANAGGKSTLPTTGDPVGPFGLMLLIGLGILGIALLSKAIFGLRVSTRDNRLSDRR